MAILVQAELVEHGVRVETGIAVTEVTASGVRLADGREIPGELVIGSIGVRPDTRLAEMAGLDVGPRGGIAVDDAGRTSHPDVYAVGDAVEKVDSVGGGQSLIAAGQRGQPAGPSRGRPHRRARGPAGAVARHRHRQGLLPHRGDDRLEREAPPGGGSSVPRSSAPTR